MKPIMSFIFSTLIMYTWGYGGRGSVLYTLPIHISDQSETSIQTCTDVAPALVTQQVKIHNTDVGHYICVADKPDKNNLDKEHTVKITVEENTQTKEVVKVDP